MTGEVPEGHSSESPEALNARLVDWAKLHRMPTGRILFLRPGDVLILPAGTYHYVYTSKQKLVVGAFPSHCHLANLSPIYRPLHFTGPTACLELDSGGLPQRVRLANTRRVRLSVWLRQGACCGPVRALPLRTGQHGASPCRRAAPEWEATLAGTGGAPSQGVRDESIPHSRDSSSFATDWHHFHFTSRRRPQ